MKRIHGKRKEKERKKERKKNILEKLPAPKKETS